MAAVVVSPMSSGEFTAQVQDDVDVTNFRVSVSKHLLRELDLPPGDARRVAAESVKELMGEHTRSSLPSVLDVESYWRDDRKFREGLTGRLQGRGAA
jgi:hypothetical protein